MPINFGQPPTSLGDILGGLGSGGGGGGLMELLNLLFRGGAGRQAFMPGITGGRTMAGVPAGGAVPQHILPEPGAPLAPRPPTVKPTPTVAPRPTATGPGGRVPIGTTGLWNPDDPTAGLIYGPPAHDVPDPWSTPGIPGPQPTGGPGSRWWERPTRPMWPRPTRPFTPKPIIPGARPFDPGPGGFPFAPQPGGTIGGFMDIIKGKLFGPGGGDSVRPIFNPAGPGGAITRGGEGGFTGGISFAPGTGPKERAAAGDVLGRAMGSPAQRFKGGISFAPGTGAKERSAASDTLGRVLGGF